MFCFGNGWAASHGVITLMNNGRTILCNLTSTINLFPHRSLQNTLQNRTRNKVLGRNDALEFNAPKEESRKGGECQRTVKGRREEKVSKLKSALDYGNAVHGSRILGEWSITIGYKMGSSPAKVYTTAKTSPAENFKHA